MLMTQNFMLSITSETFLHLILLVAVGETYRSHKSHRRSKMLNVHAQDVMVIINEQFCVTDYNVQMETVHTFGFR